MTALRSAFVILLLVVAVCSPGSIDSAAQSHSLHFSIQDEEYAGMWTEGQALPTTRKQMRNSTVVLNDKIYVIGGIDTDSGLITAAVDVYDPSSDTWSSAAELPQPLWRSAAVVLNEKIYLFGGYRSPSGFPFNPTDASYAYDPELDQWEEIAPLPFARGSHFAVALDDRIYVIGGATNTPLGSNSIYDPATDTWSEGEAMPSRRAGLSGAVIDGKIYAAGGYILSAGVLSRNILEAYDPETDTWESLEPMPTTRHGIGAVALDGKLIVVGGQPAWPLSKLLQYDPSSNEWSELTTMPNPVVFMGVAQHEGRIYAFGGGVEGLNQRSGISDTQIFIMTQNEE